MTFVARDSQPQEGRNAATFIALIGVLICSLGLLALVALVIPAFLWVLAVFAGLVGIGMLQYVLWGWKLDRDRLPDDGDDPKA